jgi:hypothetical protein
MKAIKDCEFEVKIMRMPLQATKGIESYWVAETYDVQTIRIESDKEYKNKESAKRNFRKFAKLNGIANYKFTN